MSMAPYAQSDARAGALEELEEFWELLVGSRSLHAGQAETPPSSLHPLQYIHVHVCTSCIECLSHCAPLARRLRASPGPADSGAESADWQPKPTGIAECGESNSGLQWRSLPPSPPPPLGSQTPPPPSLPPSPPALTSRHRAHQHVGTCDPHAAHISEMLEVRCQGCQASYRDLPQMWVSPSRYSSLLLYCAYFVDDTRYHLHPPCLSSDREEKAGR